jgi:hypothetical protein
MFSTSPLIANSEAAFDDTIDLFLKCVLFEFPKFMLKEVVEELFNLYTLQEIYSISIFIVMPLAGSHQNNDNLCRSYILIILNSTSFICEVLCWCLRRLCQDMQLKIAIYFTISGLLDAKGFVIIIPYVMNTAHGEVSYLKRSSSSSGKAGKSSRSQVFAWAHNFGFGFRWKIRTCFLFLHTSFS